MDKQKVVEIAKNSGFDPHDMSCDFTVNLENILEFAAAILREAAGVCEQISDDYSASEGRKWPELKTDAETGARDCQLRIEHIAEELTK